MSELTKENNDIYDNFYELEKYVSEIDQYSRRNNVEFRNIPENIGITNIEKHIIKVLGSIGVVVQSYDIVAVHCLGKSTVNKNRSVIVRFLNRKHIYSCLKNSKKLSTPPNASMKKIFITENLCPSNKNLFNYLYKLKKDSKIKSVWSFDGIVYFKLSDDTSECPIRVHHVEEVEDYLVESERYWSRCDITIIFFCIA